MKFNIIFLTLLLSISSFARAEAVEKRGASSAQDEPRIRVLLANEVKGVLLEAQGGYKILNRKNELLSHASRGKRFVVHALSNGVRWGEEFPGIYGISIHPLEPSTHFFVDGKQYKGVIHVYCLKNGLVNIVNEVTIEDYVKSTLALKISSNMAREALEAIAIAARTNAYAATFYKNEGNAFWDISAEEAGYLGFGVTMGKQGIDHAVVSTRYIVLEEKKGIPMRHVGLSTVDAEALASKGLDAARILRNAIPHSEIGSITAYQRILR